MMKPSFLARLSTLRLCAAAIATAGVLSGCASTLAPHNGAIDSSMPRSDYRVGTWQRDGAPRSLALGLNFSGGGSRAAALAYGVMEELAKTRVEIDGKTHRMLDLVETLSAVSGGSYTAAYYGLFGDRLFEDFETRFLKRDIQDEITGKVLSFSNLIRMTSPFFGRSDVTAEFLDDILFEGQTFADMEQAIRKGHRPFVVINATDMARTSRFEFTQDQFDLLCSDLGKYRISRAVAASSAVPVVFSPITLTNYAGSCGFDEPQWITRALTDRQHSVRRYALASDLRTYLDSRRRKYVHLLDGGLSDNLGLRFMLDRLTLSDPGEMIDTFQRSNLRRLVQIVVNAQARHDFPELDRYAEVPTLRAIAFSVANTTDRYNVETLAFAHSSMQAIAQAVAQRQAQQNPENKADVEALLIEISFEDLGDPEERAYFNALPTNFNLPPEAIDRLREVGARLLRNSPDFQRLLRDLPKIR